jgi:hypothetical protein
VEHFDGDSAMKISILPIVATTAAMIALWGAMYSVMEIEQQDGRDMDRLLSQDVIFTGLISGLAIMAIKFDQFVNTRAIDFRDWRDRRAPGADISARCNGAEGVSSQA